MHDGQSRPEGFLATRRPAHADDDRAPADALHRQVERERVADRVRSEELALDLDRRKTHPMVLDELCVALADAFVEPVLDELMEQHEIMRIEDDSRRIAMLETNELFLDEHVRPVARR